VPVGWLLYYAAFLPSYVGLFFVALFGLLLGAVMYRLGQICRPLPKRTVRAGVAVVVLFVWLTSILIEAYDFPAQVADYCYEKIRKLPEGTTPQAFRHDCTEDVTRHLREKFPPGGVIGYVRWSITSSRIDPPVAHLPRPFRSTQYRWWWVGRVLLSLMLLAVAVNSQVAALTRPADSPERDGTAGSPLSKI
jgi:hypothetical protein